LAKLYVHVYLRQHSLIIGIIDFEVTDRLPNVTFSLSRQWAGNVAVGRKGSPDDSLFFWAMEKENGSLTAKAGENSDAPWGVWLNGG
jgi:carboxypeptidase D